MGAIRACVYAEGALELAVEWPWTVPGDELGDDELGPAHHLVRRCIARARSCSETAVRFVAPVRDAGRTFRGSQLYERRSVGRILAAHSVMESPVDLVVLVVDQDGQNARAAEIAGWAGEYPHVRAAIGVPVREFEAWLLGDWATAVRALPSPIADPGPPERLDPGRARSLLPSSAELRECRATIARTADLDAIAARCPSFAEFLAQLRP